MEDIRIWAELAVTRFFDGIRFVVRRLVGVPTGDASPPPAHSRRRAQSENNVGSSHEDVSRLTLCVLSVWLDITSAFEPLWWLHSMQRLSTCQHAMVQSYSNWMQNAPDHVMQWANPSPKQVHER